jgi:hypothetical protein
VGSRGADEELAVKLMIGEKMLSRGGASQQTPSCHDEVDQDATEPAGQCFGVEGVDCEELGLWLPDDGTEETELKLRGLRKYRILQ